MAKKQREIQKEIERLEKELQTEKDLNESAWNTWGSELCAGEMINRERVLEERIEHLKKSLYVKL